jgi:hypothetical protein
MFICKCFVITRLNEIAAGAEESEPGARGKETEESVEITESQSLLSSVTSAKGKRRGRMMKIAA